jgi:hypothetical protein
MADWKQITARIRRARTGKDPGGQLTNLFSKTRDAMVAFELARYLESIGNSADAGRWYLTAAERFRRADWKTKAQESATRLGATTPAEIPLEALSSAAAHPAEPRAQSLEAAASPELAAEQELQQNQNRSLLLRLRPLFLVAAGELVVARVDAIISVPQDPLTALPPSKSRAPFRRRHRAKSPKTVRRKLRLLSAPSTAWPKHPPVPLLCVDDPAILVCLRGSRSWK